VKKNDADGLDTTRFLVPVFTSSNTADCTEILVNDRRILNYNDLIDNADFVNPTTIVLTDHYAVPTNIN